MSRTTFAVGALLLLLGPAAAYPGSDTLSDTLRATGSGAVWKYTESGVTRYYAEPGDLRYGQWYSTYPPASGHEHGTALFDLSPIPDTALVLGVELGFCQYSDDTAGTPPCGVRAYDYAGTDPETLFNSIDTADDVSSLQEARNGWNRVPLTEAGTRWVEAHLPSDHCRLAIAEDAWGELGEAHGCGAAESLRPYLLVRYLPAGIEEAGRPQPDAGLGLFPNPAVSAVTIHCPPDWTGRAVLTLWDASGRVVCSQPVRHSPSAAGIPVGQCAIRTSSLPAGVYVARLVSGSIRASARLVVQHR